MIHGLFGHLNLPELHHALAPIKPHAPDLIGYGRQRQADTTGLSLDDQAQHVIRYIETLGTERVHLLGHSVGGAVAARVAHLRPDLLLSLISVEGNFTLKDAFWSAQIAQKSLTEVEDILAGYRAAPLAWMANAIDTPSPLTNRLAQEWLNHQPARTIRAQANAVVAATTPDSYRTELRATFASDLPVYLIAGQRSAAGWDVPDWANTLCRARFNIANTGHLMMAEDPERFAQTLLSILSAPRAALT